MRTIAYFDCFSGASGDMILGALFDAGAQPDAVRQKLKGLPIQNYALDVQQIRKQGFSAAQCVVSHDEHQPHRHLADVLEIIARGGLSERVRVQASRVFERLAEAEARAHGTSVAKVHFHEVGAVDAIVDIVGACCALEELAVDEVHCSAMAVGSGTVNCAHGTMPVPAPATAALLENVPIDHCSERGELTTPTGAALLTTWAEQFGPCPSMTLGKIGYGAGQRDGQSRPNLLRVMLGTAQGDTADEIAVLEANIDDQSPEIIGHTLTKLMAEGALDAFCQPIYMKKGRPGLLLTALCEQADVARLSSIIFTQSSTFGVRHSVCRRHKLLRRQDSVSIDGHAVRLKVGMLNNDIVTVSPEYEDCRALAEESGMPLKQIMSQASAMWHQSHGTAD